MHTMILCCGDCLIYFFLLLHTDTWKKKKKNMTKASQYSLGLHMFTQMTYQFGWDHIPFQFGD